ncbi:Arginase family enzyme [Flavobacteriaceae bacterium MAR_2010_188]|nr:Arginase family enzyme [Flavobacteriaceae bacterium MAR_2010_188]
MFNFLSPVSDVVLAHKQLLPEQSLGNRIKIHSAQGGIPELDNVKIAILGVSENRNDVDYIGEPPNFDYIRKALYSLYPGNWDTLIADLGDIAEGDSIEDTYFALRTTLTVLLEKNIIPIILGGSQDLTYCNYRAFDNIVPMVNVVNVDSSFDLGDSSTPIKNDSYLGKIILDQPYNLFNYSTIGYQTYFNSQEEIDLMEKLYFEAYRLGEINNSIEKVEPVMRDGHIVSIDLKAVRSSDFGFSQGHSPNGFDGKEICTISRYAGISNKVASFGIYEYKAKPKDEITPMLVAQICWYFIEGVNCRVKDDNFQDENAHQKYNVLIDDEELIFYKSLSSGRWWIEIPFLSELNNKLKKHTLLPCMYQDYLEATNGKVPERWYKAYKKNGY